ncbi:hypothetical protein J4530_08875 [Neisseria subflava]|uniref:hypothetical protein n=1 Tax=Neisseria subflava TaxID=28449 RepID=UPI00202A1966|nr:hypothetical protein [Neisseria subflava]MCL9788263.1 hypothetical protein [Neisseria subflava]
MFERAKTWYNRLTSCRFCRYVKAALSWAWNLRFLPDSARRWVFGTGTRALQIVNIGFFAGLGLGVWRKRFWLAAAVDGAHQIAALVCGAHAVAVGAAVGVVDVEQQPRSHAVGVGALRITPLIWLLLATSFWVRHTLAAQVVGYVFGIWSLAVWLVGEHLQDIA